ncbi:MBL fold metallo-hydrolase, partial [Streptomyces sp. SID625]|nr:MBL fold metallo-hydrolase [Streptomyces sp. SID625]
PRLSRPRVSGDHMAPVSVLAEAEVRRIQRPGGAAATTRAPVLVLVSTRAPGAEHKAATGPRTDGSEARNTSPWLGLLPSTRLRVTGRLAPPLTGGDRIAAVLKVQEV